jgi:hypothetical protein
MHRQCRTNLRGIHHEIQGFRKAFESLDQQDDPEQVIQALLGKVVPASNDVG